MASVGAKTKLSPNLSPILDSSDIPPTLMTMHGKQKGAGTAIDADKKRTLTRWRRPYERVGRDLGGPQLPCSLCPFDPGRHFR